MKKKHFILAAFYCFICFACSEESKITEEPGQPENGEETLKYEEPKRREDIPLTRSEESINEQNKGFAFKLFQAANITLPEEETEQLVVSPLSATYALSMAANGAATETLEEMLALLGFEGFTTEEVNSYNQKLVKYLSELDNTAPVHTANSMWVQNGFSILDSYKEALVKNYDAEVQNVDFADNQTIDILNSWCSEKTEGGIPEYFKQLSPNLKVLLMNALYFNGSWREPFSAEKTIAADFTEESGKKSKVQMMSQSITLPYAQNDAFAMVEVPFGNKAFSMAIILPKAGITLNECIAGLSNEVWNSCQEQKQSTLISLELPKFKVEQKFLLNDALQNMGMVKAFSANADFSKISNNSLFISEVNQGTFIDVDEYGTKAAAITSIEMELLADGEKEITYTDFHVNRPFLFFIKEKSTGTILFMGKMTKI
ncbi:MAG: serpin family protein [Bacteroides sp.]|nr:serpin family protein [Bacteroides sp.]